MDTITRNLITHRTSTSAPILRRETLDGREYLVAPVILIREQVLNGILTLREEITRFVDSWNDIPVPVSHPTDSSGQYILAKSPDVIRDRVIGRLFNAVWDDEIGALRSEMWLDVQKCHDLGGQALQVLKDVEAGRLVEVSTGYMANTEEISGEFNGVPYTAVARDIHPDHLAVLPNEIGACSVRDGCGVPRVNSAARCDCTACVKNHACANLPENYTINAAHSGVMVALYIPANIAGDIALDAATLPPGSSPVPAAELHLTLGYFGKADTVTFSQNELLTAVAMFAKHAPLVRGQFGGVGRFKKVEDDNTNPFYLSFDSPQFPEWRRQLIGLLSDFGAHAASEHGFTPHVTLAYLPVNAPTPNLAVGDDEIIFPFIAVAWANQVTLFPLQGLPREDMDGPVATAVTTFTQESIPMPQTNELAEVVDEAELETTETAETTQAEDSATVIENEAETVEAQPDPVAAPDLAQLVADAVAAAFAPYQETLTALQVNANRERETLVTEILGAPNCAFNREQLQKVDVAFLANLAQTLRTPDYSANGHVQTNAAVVEDALQPIEQPALFG